MRRFAFRLALALGYVDPDAMLASIGAAKFQEWVAYYELEPFGEERADLRMAIGTATIANQWRGQGHGLKVPDLMPEFAAEREPQTAEEMKQMLRRWTAMCGGTIGKPNGNNS